MHIAASNPICREPSELDPALWAAEVERHLPALQRLGVTQAKARLEAYKKVYEREQCLMLQPYIKNPDLSIGKLLSKASEELGVSINVVHPREFTAAV